LSLSRARTLGSLGSLLSIVPWVLYTLSFVAPTSAPAYIAAYGVFGLVGLIGFISVMEAVEYISKDTGDRSIIDGLVVDLAIASLGLVVADGLGTDTSFSLLGTFNRYFGSSLSSIDLRGIVGEAWYLTLYFVAAVFGARSLILIGKKLELRLFRASGLATVAGVVLLIVVGEVVILAVYALTLTAFLSIKAPIKAPSRMDKVVKVKTKSWQLWFSEKDILDVRKVRTPFLSNVTSTTFATIVAVGLVSFVLYPVDPKVFYTTRDAAIFAGVMGVLWLSRKRFPVLPPISASTRTESIPWENVLRLELGFNKISLQLADRKYETKTGRSVVTAIWILARPKILERLIIK